MNKGIWINVFKNKRHEENEKAPVMNVIINFPDGSVLEGGLWEKVSKAGTNYLNGQLRPAQTRNNRGAVDPPFEAPATKSVKVDW
jgi:uncharacterized protein (DUF736 family)